MKGKRIAPLLALARCRQTRIQGRGATFFGGNDAWRVQRPGHDCFAVMRQAPQFFNGNGLGFELQNRSSLAGKFRHQASGQVGPPLPDQAVCEFASANTRNARCGKQAAELCSHLLPVDEKLQHGRMKIGLKDTIGAVHGAEGADVQDLVATTDILPRSRTAADEGTLVAGQKKCVLAGINGIRRRSHLPVDLCRTVDNHGGHFQARSDFGCQRIVGDLSIDKKSQT